MLESLGSSLGPLQRFFLDHRGTPRVIALVSPTCAACVTGARTLADKLAALGPTAPATGVVWVDMLSPDGPEAAEKSSAIFRDTSPVAQFHDPERTAARGFSRFFGWKPEALAWDLYLFYGPDADDLTRHPDIGWTHQLRRPFGIEGIDPEHFCPPERLDATLGELARRTAASTAGSVASS